MARDRKRARQRRERVGRGTRQPAEGARSPERSGGSLRTASPASALPVGSPAPGPSGAPAGSGGLPEAYGGTGPELAAELARGPLERTEVPEAGAQAETEAEPGGLRGEPLAEPGQDGGDAVGVDADSPVAPAPDELEEEEDDGEHRYGFGRSLPGRTAARPGGRPGRARQQSLLDRTVAFLRASWAELQRMQWPDRRQTSQATAVVLGFVVVAGVYLGVADWVAQKIVNLIL